MLPKPGTYRAFIIVYTYMLRIRNLTKYIQGEPLFKELSLTVHRHDRIGIVGPNGAGKSTLLKIIIGEVETDTGSVEIDRETLGYLRQEPLITPDSNPLSGGQKTKLALTKLLATKPTMLLLDEPTNHLDEETLLWLKDTLQNYAGAVVIVSHDRWLLNQTVTRIIELDAVNQTITEYPGNYDAYIQLRAKQLEKWKNRYDLQQREKRRLENWLALKRQEATAHPDPAKGKQVRMMERRIQREIYDREIPRPQQRKILSKLGITGNAHGSKLLIKAHNLTKGYDERTLFKNLDLEIRGAERILLQGPNGSGKTTLLKVIVNEAAADAGEITIGNNVHIGYFAQEHETLNPKKTVLEEFLHTDGLQLGSYNPRSVLGSFLFIDDDVFKKVSDLSLGERVRLIFAKLLQQQHELLILDEPTNHLDIASREAIEQALQNYQGAILVVSHDRYFLQQVGITKIWHLANNTIKEILI
jgi:ATP-binding cassette subfamily F protein 3